MATDRWEYCRVYDRDLTFYTSNGKHEVKAREHFAAVAQLGDEGWELAATSGVNATLYFKRRKQ